MSNSKQRLDQSLRQKFVVGFLSAIGIDGIIARKVLKDPAVKRQLKDVDKTLQKLQDSAALAKKIAQQEGLNYF